MISPAEGEPIAKGRLDSSEAPFYYSTFLWATQADYERAAGAERGNTKAMCITDTWLCEVTGEAVVHPKLGEIHFVKGNWNLGTIAHEVTHALLHRLRYLAVRPETVIPELTEGYRAANEEILAYEAGHWVESLHAWLSRHDPAQESSPAD